MLEAKKTIYTIGHSTHAIDYFIDVLRIYRIQVIADVRRFPTSKTNPQFQLEPLQRELARVGIAYHWFGQSLGGFRTGGYELYMQSQSFLQGIEQLTAIAQATLTAIMCAEKLFFRCHRRFIADYLASRDWQVIHIFDENRTYPHVHAQTLPLQ